MQGHARRGEGARQMQGHARRGEGARQMQGHARRVAAREELGVTL
jgi:hypothetical protein